MYTFIVVTHIFLCVFLIFVVLLQSGKSDMGSAFGGGGSQAVLTPAGGTTLLGKVTAIVATLFMVTSMSLAWYTNSEARGGSIIEGDLIDELERELPGQEAPAPASAPIKDEAAPQGDAPAGGAGLAPAPAQDRPAAVPAPAQVPALEDLGGEEDQDSE